MKNYISVNMKYSKAASYSKIMEHNSRITKIDYLKNKQNLRYGDNVHIEYAKLEHLQEKREKQKSKFATKTQKSENELCEFVLVLSEEQFKKCSKQEIVEHLKKLVENYKKKWGFEPISLDLHLDEGEGENTNIHAHFLAYNFNFEKNKSILRTLKKQDFEKMQDVAAEAFKNLGFVRGESKKKTHREHLPPHEYKQAKESQKAIKKAQLNNNMIKNVENILKKSKTFFSYDVEILKKEMLKHFKFYANLNIMLQENKILQEQLFLKNIENTTQKQAFEQKEQQFSKQQQQSFENLKKLQSDFDNLKKVVDKLENENDKQQKQIFEHNKQLNNPNFLKCQIEKLKVGTGGDINI